MHDLDRDMERCMGIKTRDGYIDLDATAGSDPDTSEFK